MSGVTLHLLIPGLLDRTLRWVGDFGPLPRFAGIEALLARASKSTVPADGVDACLCGLFGLVATKDLDLPLGALRRYGFGRDVDRAVWLCADPVNLKADMTSVYLRGSGSLNITELEARGLGEIFATHFAGSGLALEITSRAYWHLRLPATSGVTTHAQRQVMGQAVQTCLPAGPDAARWGSFLNETQMLFHGCEINRARESRNEPIINGLWLAGAGPLPARERLRVTVAAVWSDDPLARGLARLADIETKPAPATLDGLLSAATRDAHLVTLENLLSPARYDDFSVWCSAMTALEKDWFEPLARAIRNGQVTECNIYDCLGGRYRIDRARQWRIWRRPRSLDAFAGVAGSNR
ncbi:MAG: hypothetical protein H0V62_10535 [Gammaproteobacteria bacterium]|nr:hypothetical protein [Gammaproteobacteria bacterium]